MLKILAAIPAILWVFGWTSVPAGVVINEIHYDPADRTVPGEFVELYNRGEQAVDLSGWYFSDGIRFTFPPGTILGPGRYLVAGQNPVAITEIYGPTPLVGPFRGRLNNQGERLALRDSRGRIVDEVDYRRRFPWPIVGGREGRSIELIHPDLDNDLGSSWRPSNPGPAGENLLIREKAVWRYLRGTGEASQPRGAWRQISFDDSRWSAGRTSIGYGESFISTRLPDMPGRYLSIYLRKKFEVENPAELEHLLLEVQFDDGFNAWINGTHVAGSNMASGEPSHGDSALAVSEDLEFRPFSIPRPGRFLVPGTNVLAIQVHNVYLSRSSDAFIDARLKGASGASRPTPGRRNSIFTDNVPPRLQRVRHRPERPKSRQPVTITAEVLDGGGVLSIHLLYQVVNPGSYIEIGDPEFERNWQSLPMRDGGTEGDERAGDSIYSVRLPPSLQAHRRLVRYRIRAVDGDGNRITAPFPDDPQPNFAYFVYDGAPPWSGAIRPGSRDPVLGRVVHYPAELMNRLPIYHLITRRSSAEEANWRSRYGGSQYPWRGTLVYDGEVYDHIRYRMRGGSWRYAMGQNMWKFDFLRGHGFQARDDHGRKYRTSWDKLNFSAIIQQGDFGHRGEQGLFESVGFKLFNLFGVPAPRTHFVHFRIIDEAGETGSSQYTGDLWGLYLAIEQMDGRFLEEHGLPDGNLYKMEFGGGELNNQGFQAVRDRSDVLSFLQALRRRGLPDSWWRDHLNLEGYYRYRCALEGIHHYDNGSGKNYFFYLHPGKGRWSVFPWDIDLSWADNMYGNGEEPLKHLLARPAFRIEYQNHLREFRDLLFNRDQAWRLIDEMAAIIDDPRGGPSWVDIDRALWDYHPVLADSSLVNFRKTRQGLFYRISPSRDFPGMVREMKSYVVSRGSWMDRRLARDPAIPHRPAITYAGPPGFPIDSLLFRASPFRDPQGSGTFGAMKWRIAGVTPPGAPSFHPRIPGMYEIKSTWESEELAAFQEDLQAPGHLLEIGRTYRIRLRMKDDTGRWSHWSAPLEFTAGGPAAPFPQQRYLRITEIRHRPPEGSDLEFLEFLNTGPDVLDLRPVSLRKGIEFDFASSPIRELGPGEFVVIVKNEVAFRAAYDAGSVNMAGEYSGSLSNRGERLLLTYGAGAVILDFEYPPGQGNSLVADDPWASRESWEEPGFWRAGAGAEGTPGALDGDYVPGGWQLPGDANQDGSLDLSDAYRMLIFLYRKEPLLPCQGENLNGGGNRRLLDVNADGQVDLVDSIHLINYVVGAGSSPLLGKPCRRIRGCPDAVERP